LPNLHQKSSLLINTMSVQVESHHQQWSFAGMTTPAMFRSPTKVKEAVAEDPEAELLDMLENGFARESIAQECLSPRCSSPSGSSIPTYQRLRFKRIGKMAMELYTDDVGDSKRFLLSAKRIKDTFYISPYQIRKFQPDPERDRPNPLLQCAIMKKVPYGTSGHCYRLMLDGCQGCSRNQIYDGVCEEDADQKLLAEIWHATTVLKECDLAL
jgi:hypothetical protein